MLSYIKLKISIHGLYRSRVQSETKEQIAQRIKNLILEKFGLEYDSDVEVEISESAGSETKE